MMTNTAAILIGAEPLQDATSYKAVWKIAPKRAAGCCVAAEGGARDLKIQRGNNAIQLVGGGIGPYGAITFGNVEIFTGPSDQVNPSTVNYTMISIILWLSASTKKGIRIRSKL